MDGAYTAAAAQYGFECRGCEDNCCQTRFYHHTLLEYLYLFEGYRQLDSGLQQELRQRAHVVSAYQVRPDRDIRHDGHMCPLNIDGLCRLYAHRPMICRLHGLPHDLHLGNGRVVRGPGCDLFVEQCGERPYVVFDRTPFYTRMAVLEKSLRRDAGYRHKIKMTVAEMLCCF
jgi:Fe-S-cluster containining protein